MKTLIFKYAASVICALMFCFSGFGQQYKVEYNYDEFGNRELRQVIIISHKHDTVSEEISQNGNANHQEHYDLSFADKNITVYPNPVTSGLTVEISPFDPDENISILISTSQGVKCIEFQNVKAVSHIDLESHPAGIYMLTLQNGNLKKSWKVVKK